MVNQVKNFQYTHKIYVWQNTAVMCVCECVCVWNVLWELFGEWNSREREQARLLNAEERYVDEPSFGAKFSSSNFRAYSCTFLSPVCL